MAKYAGCLTTRDVCKLECKECRETLIGYDVPEDVIRTITDMIEEAYFQLGQAYTSARMFEAFVKDEYGDKASAKFLKMRMGQIPCGKALAEEMDKERREIEKQTKHMN